MQARGGSSIANRQREAHVRKRSLARLASGPSGDGTLRSIFVRPVAAEGGWAWALVIVDLDLDLDREGDGDGDGDEEESERRAMGLSDATQGAWQAYLS